MTLLFRIFGSIVVLIQIHYCTGQNAHLTDNTISNLSGQDMVSTLLTSILDRLTSMDNRLNSLDQRITALDQRITALLLSDRHSVEEQGSADEGCGEDSVSVSTTVEPTTVVPQTSPTPQVRDVFTVTRLSKEDRGDFYTVTVEYEADTKPVAVLLKTAHEEIAKPQDNADLGVFAVRIPKELQESETHGFLSLPRYIFVIYPDVHYTLGISLNYMFERSPDTQDIPRVTLYVTQGGDVIFSPGSDAELDVTLKVEGGNEAVDYDSLDYQIAVKTDTDAVTRYYGYIGETVSEDERPVLLEVVKNEGERGDRNVKFKINSTLADPRGILVLGGRVAFDCHYSCLLRDVTVQKDVRFYSQEHTAPFPTGFLGFVYSQYKDGPTVEYCNARPVNGKKPPCPLFCEAFGSEPSRMKWERVLSNGDVTPTNDVRLAASYWSTSQLEFDDVTFADAGDYLCTATSDTTSITRTVTVVVYTAPVFDEDASAIRLGLGGTVVVTCVAEGTPAPNVTFVTDDYPLSDVSEENYDVTTTQLNVTTTRSTLVIRESHDFAPIRMVKCRAENVPDTDQYRHYVTHTVYYN